MGNQCLVDGCGYWIKQDISFSVFSMYVHEYEALLSPVISSKLFVIP